VVPKQFGQILLLFWGLDHLGEELLQTLMIRLNNEKNAPKGIASNVSQLQ
jgi:hypothetical protein